MEKIAMNLASSSSKIELKMQRLAKFWHSDRRQQNFHLARLFLEAYSPYILPPICLFGFFFVLRWITYDNIAKLWQHSELRVALFAASGSILATLAAIAYNFRSTTCYLVHFACFKPAQEHKLTHEICEYMTEKSGRFTESSVLFQVKVLLKSGLGEETYAPSFLFEADDKPCLNRARDETKNLLYGALNELFYKTEIQPKEVDFLIINVGMFYPAPSLSSHVVNRYKMRTNIKSYNISGMGCAAGMVAVDLAKDILRVHKNSYVVIAGTEPYTLNWYYGNDRSMLVPNCLFRCGSYALMLSNKKADRRRSAFQLLHSVRTTMAADDNAYDCIVTREDDDGIVGTSISAKLLDVASAAMRVNIKQIIVLTIPATELLKVLCNMIKRKVLKIQETQYLPDLKKVITHFCLHPGGKAVINGMGKSLGLTDHHLEPARMTLYRFGNTSSSGLWYAMAYCEAMHRLKKGDTIWQMALGSGFKCNSVIWRVLQDVYPVEGCNPWLDCIHRYPVENPDTILPTNYLYRKLQKAERKCRER